MGGVPEEVSCSDYVAVCGEEAVAWVDVLGLLPRLVGANVAPAGSQPLVSGSPWSKNAHKSSAAAGTDSIAIPVAKAWHRVNTALLKTGDQYG